MYVILHLCSGGPGLGYRGHGVGPTLPVDIRRGGGGGFLHDPHGVPLPLPEHGAHRRQVLKDRAAGERGPRGVTLHNNRI